MTVKAGGCSAGAAIAAVNQPDIGTPLRQAIHWLPLVNFCHEDVSHPQRLRHNRVHHRLGIRALLIGLAIGAVDQKIQQSPRRVQLGDQWFVFHGISAQIASKSIVMINYIN